MWAFLSVTLAFVLGWGLSERRGKTLQAEKPELMFFNDDLSRWERVTEVQLRANGNIIARIPVKKVEDGITN